MQFCNRAPLLQVLVDVLNMSAGYALTSCWPYTAGEPHLSLSLPNLSHTADLFLWGYWLIVTDASALLHVDAVLLALLLQACRCQIHFPQRSAAYNNLSSIESQGHTVYYRTSTVRHKHAASAGLTVSLMMMMVRMPSVYSACKCMQV